jgi:hypothetical protein
METAELSRVVALYDERVRGHDKSLPGYAAAWGMLRETLLDLGGQAVVPPLCYEDSLRELLESGVSFGGKSTLVKGDPCQCHANSAALFDLGRADGIGTGYALSDDGLWRQHSWGVKGTRVLETTVRREMYFGTVLRGERAEAFSSENY